MLMAVVFGIGVGIISAVRQNTWADYLSMSLAVMGISVPLFVVGPVLGTVIVYSVILIVLNFVVDIVYGYLDPRISYK